MGVCSAVEIAARVRGRESTAVQELAATRTACEQRNDRLNAFVHLDWEVAEHAASMVDDQLARGLDPGPLAGVPFGVKDLHHVAGMPTRFGSLLHAEDAPYARDSPSVARLRSAGAVPVGKTATAEFGMDSLTVTRAHGVTRNPWDPVLTPGGSSGGSAAAVSAGIVPFATGTDEGGSVRSPASFCGLFGIKPTHGLVARDDGCSETNVVGLLSRSVADAALVLDVVAGGNTRDKMSLGRSRPPPSFSASLDGVDLTGLSACWSSDLGYASVEPEVADHCREAARRLTKGAGVRLSEGTVAMIDPAEAWMPIVASRFRRRLLALGVLEGREEQLSAAALAFLGYAAEVSAVDLANAEQTQLRLEAQVSELFGRYDLLLTPTVACPAFRAEGPVPDTIAGQPASIVGAEPFTMLANLTWLPAVSVPVGLSSSGLPIGIQIHARWWHDSQLLAIARTWEASEPWALCAPGWVD